MANVVGPGDVSLNDEPIRTVHTHSCQGVVGGCLVLVRVNGHARARLGQFESDPLGDAGELPVIRACLPANTMATYDFLGASFTQLELSVAGYRPKNALKSAPEELPSVISTAIVTRLRPSQLSFEVNPIPVSWVHIREGLSCAQLGVRDPARPLLRLFP